MLVGDSKVAAENAIYQMGWTRFDPYLSHRNTTLPAPLSNPIAVHLEFTPCSIE